MWNLQQLLKCPKCPAETSTPIYDGIVHDFQHVPRTIEGKSTS